MKSVIAFVLLFTFSYSFGQKAVSEIKNLITAENAEAHITFLASDNLRGRGTGTPEIAIAADYIAAQFRSSGIKPASPAGYFQEVGLQRTFTPGEIELRIGDELFIFRKDLVLLKGQGLDQPVDLVYLGFGDDSSWKGANLRGKVVVVDAGSSPTSTMREAFLIDAPRKYALAKSAGALALIEIARFESYPWENIVNRFGNGRVALSGDDFHPDVLPHMWMARSESQALSRLVKETTLSGNLRIKVRAPEQVPGKNVVGVISGTDAKLQSEYVALTGHYDHVGVRKAEGTDSIYNGARDNAIGTTAVIEAARYFSAHPTKRSIILIAFCAEEEGLLGSKWYAAHPLIPLQKTVFNLDCDGAGYNDKSLANIVDLNRTTADDLLTKACLAFGLTLKGDPAPGMNLYERSDNYNFAAKGVPAVDMSPGVKGMDDEILKYYHRPADEASSLDFAYLATFLRSYVYGASLILNAAQRPQWKPGDKFEGAGKLLYGAQ